MSVRLEFWRKHIEAKEASGLSVEQYCRDHHLTTSQYYNWRAKVRSLDAEPKFVRVAGTDEYSIVVAEGVRIVFDREDDFRSVGKSLLAGLLR